VWIVGKVSVNHNQVSGGNQFVSVDNRTSIDFKNGRRCKTVRAVIFGYPRIDTQYFLNQGILKQSVVNTIGFFLAVEIVHGTIAQPQRLFQVAFVIAGIDVIKIVMEQIQVCQSFHSKIFLLGHELQGNDITIGINGKGTIECFLIGVEYHPNRKCAG
tara:strand:- start:1122 stop:1595 length:474 start_codon:yes stop_codon:yes gene_type:complete